MNELIKVEISENNEQIVRARLLHEFLEVKTKFNDWISKRIEKYNFTENIDFEAVTQKKVTAQGNEIEFKDYWLKIDMAKELSMIENNEKGSLARKYFIECANKWNSPEMILIKADQIKSRMLENYEKEIKEIQLELEYKNEIIRGITDDIDIYKKQAILNRVVKHKGANFRDRWNELYRVFRETYHIDLKARKEGYNLKQARAKDKYRSVLEYAVAFDFIEDLYKIALKLYESDMNEIIEQIRKVA